MLKSYVTAVLLIGFVCACRLMPHFANFSPMIFLALFMTRFFNKAMAFGMVIIAMIVSDILLSMHSSYSTFGSWTWFTYSALLMIGYVGSKIGHLEERFSLGMLSILGAGLGFWVWTNFGVWLCSGFYARDFAGFMQCYVAAIPFLQHSLLSAYLCFGVYVSCRYGIKAHKSVFQIRSGQV